LTLCRHIHVVIIIALQSWRIVRGPTPALLAIVTLGDLPRSRTELIVENALPRHQRWILHRQVKRPKLTK
jgi:hypothetical protein